MKRLRWWRRMWIACAVFLGGCATLTPQTVRQLEAAADTAKARAESFYVIAPKLGAKDAADAAAVESWKMSHAAGLASQAAALESLKSAVKE